MKNQDQLFEIAPSDIVGTEILDKNMPSNLDFEQPHQQIELQDVKHKSPPPQPSLPNIDPEQLPIKAYTIKGNVIFTLPPQFPTGSLAPPSTQSFQVKALNDQDYTPGLWGYWESLVGYVNREIVVDQGYIYLLSRQKFGLRSLNQWRLVDLFKVFIDLEESQLRLVVKCQGSDSLVTRDYQSNQLKQLLARLSEQANAIGLALVD